MPGAALHDTADPARIHRAHLLALMGTTTMSSLQMFLPASEPARSEALARLKKTHHVPRHLLKGLARGEAGRQGLAESGITQIQQQVPSSESRSGHDQQSG